MTLIDFKFKRSKLTIMSTDHNACASYSVWPSNSGISVSQTKSKYISGNRVTYSYLEFKLQLDVDLIYVLSRASGFGVSSVHTLLFYFLTNCTHEFWGNLMLFHGILQNIIPIVMKSTSKIIKLDGVDIV